MRNEERIDIILDKVARVWKRFPGMRFWQLLSFIGSFCPKEREGTDNFFWEDNITEQMLDDMIDKYINEEN